MNRKRGSLGAVLLILGSLAAGTGLVALAQEKSATAAVQPAAAERNLDSILINHEGYKKDRKGPVEFSHRKHALDYRIQCWECHHDYQDGKNVYSPWAETKPCYSCHDPVKKETTEMNLQRAFHLNCKTCHKKLVEEGKKSGVYRECQGCHRSQKS